MLVAHVRIVPIGDDRSMRDAVEAAVKAIRAAGARFEVGPRGTVLEADSMEQILDVVEAAHRAVAGKVPRMELSLVVEHRMDPDASTGRLGRAVAAER